MIHFLGPLLAKRSLATQRVAAQAAECGHERGAAANAIVFFASAGRSSRGAGRDRARCRGRPRPDAQDRQRLALRPASIVVVVFVNPRGLRDRHIRHGLARDVHHDVVVEFREGPAFGIIEPDFKDSGAYTPKWQPPAFGPTPSDLARFVIGLQRPIVGRRQSRTLTVHDGGHANYTKEKPASSAGTAMRSACLSMEKTRPVDSHMTEAILDSSRKWWVSSKREKAQ